MDDKYSWVETHNELTQYLIKKENSQDELIELLKSVQISPFNDRSKPGDNDIQLEEIDPFTFYCYIYKYGPTRRLENLRQIAEKLNLNIPKGEYGIPSAQAQRVWLFPYKYLRTNNEINRLWNLFNKAVANKITDEDFEDALDIKSIGKTKLTEALFYIQPEIFLPINAPIRPYLKEKLGIDPNFNTYTEYKEILEQVKLKNDLPFYELSYEAWKWNDSKGKINYWIFQGNPKSFDIETALREDILTDWTVSAHKDKIKVGDKVIIWVTGNKAGCYALAEVTAEPRIIGSSPDDHLWKVEDTNSLKAGIKITYNLVDEPLTKSEISALAKLGNLKVGSQGTNFYATKEEYKIILKMIEQKNTFNIVKKKISLNIFDHYIDLLRKIIAQLKIKREDKRIVYSVRSNNLSLTVGQRYCFTVFSSDTRGNYGVISTNKLAESSTSFGGTNPNPYYTYFQEFNPDNDTWESMIKAIEIELNRTKKSGFSSYSNIEFEDYIFSVDPKPTTPLMKFPLNTIFYGPPGTGKTYNTILRAAEIVENRKIDSYKEALTIFKSNLHNQIEFITFHQNYSYEDFIQGLRPDTKDENEQLKFKKADGVFKIIADRALANITDSKKAPLQISQSKAFMEALDNLKELVLESETPVKINDTAYFTAVEEDAFRYSGDNWTLNEKGFNGFRMKYSDLERFFEEDVQERKEIKNLNNISGLAKQHATYFIKAYELVKSLMPSIKANQEDIKQKNYIIIIDEINRANISRVFGELITLIEPDKRSHGGIPLEARLPSGDRFIVPSNLYIIGTMNTADKSIALLDIALRRRFEFESMYPKYLIENKEIYDVEILQKINELIIKSKGHDFQIGHAYFMGKDNTDLVERMNKKVIPLLLEYYMNDEKEVSGILKLAGLQIEDGSWPLKVSGKND